MKIVLSFIASLLLPAFTFAEVPAWFRQAAAAPAQTYGKDVPAVVLVNQRTDTVEPNGRVTTQVRFAVKILAAPGKEYAAARALYTTDTGEVKDLHAWMTRSAGTVKEFDKKETVDVALLDNDVYNEVRVRSIIGSSDAEIGSVFGYEATTEDRSVFTQVDFAFQTRLPAELSKYSLVLPAGWHAESITFNRSAITPTVAGSTYAWELRNLPYIQEEEAQPRLSQLVPRLAVSFFPPNGTTAGLGKTFANWSDVSQWLSELSDPRSVPDDAVTRKARELTANLTDLLEKIRAIGSYVQKIQYISIQTGLGRGGGYRPHAAGEVLAKSYGDCKDKANLMRSLLKAVNITAYPVSIYLGDSLYVHPEWPSPQQFNHAIVAVKIDDSADVASTVLNPKLGKLLIFDPTDSETPLGELSEDLRGSFGLISAGRDGDLQKMPPSDSHLNRLARELDVTLSPDGGIGAVLLEYSTGQEAVDERRSFRRMTRPEWNQIIEKWIVRGAPGASVRKVDAADQDALRFELRAEFVAPRYGQIMNNKLLVFRPAIVSRFQSGLAADARQSPVWLDGVSVEEVARFHLPAGFKVDEVPDSLHLETSFGSYDVTYKVAGQQLTSERKRVLRAGLIPAKDYESVRSFFKAINEAEQAPVVLVRQ